MTTGYKSYARPCNCCETDSMMSSTQRSAMTETGCKALMIGIIQYSGACICFITPVAPETETLARLLFVEKRTNRTRHR